MKSRSLFIGILTGLAVGGAAQAADPASKKASAVVSYFRDLRPILQRQCQGCHQPATKQGELDLTRYDAFKAGGKRGAPFQSGAADKSLIVSMLKGDLAPRMPFMQPPLKDEEIQLFRRWIAAGARDDTPSEAREAVAPGEPPIYTLPPVITALAYSPDGTTLAVSGYREVLLHKADGSGLLARLLGISDRIHSLLFSADGKLLVAAGGTPARFGEAQFWEVGARKLLRSVILTSDTVFGASLSPDASKLAVGCSDNTVRVLETVTGKELLKIGHHEDWVLGTVFGLDGKRLVSVGRDRAAKLTDASTGAFIENINLLRGELTAIARHPQRDVVLIAGDERLPYLYAMDRPRAMRIADDTTLIRKFEKQSAAIFAVAFSRDGRRVAVAGAAGEVPIYDTVSGQRVATCEGHQAGIYALAFRPDGEQLATAGFDGRVRLYAVKTGRLEVEFLPVPVQKQDTKSASWRSGL